MKKQFTILLILIFVLGLIPIGINKIITVSAEDCPEIIISSGGIFRPTESQTLRGSGFDSSLIVKFNNGKLNGAVNFFNTTQIYVTPEFSYLEPLREGNLILTNSCGKTAIYGYTTYNLPQIDSVNSVKNYEYTYSFGCNINDIDSSSKIYPGSKIRISGLNLSVSSYARELIKVYLNGKLIFSPSNTYHEIGGPCMDFSLPQDTPVGSNYIEMSNENRMQSDRFYFEVSKHDCVVGDWKCNSWNTCSADGTQTRECNLISNCENPDAVKPSITQGCIPQCREDKWKCGEWSSCSENNKQTRICIKDYDCPLIDSVSPATTQSCSYTPVCSADSWQCGGWGSCSTQGVQTRSCGRTYDCPSAETAAPATSQYCEAPNKPQHQTPLEDLGIVNQDSIVKATVKLICPVSSTMAAQGSGTVIDSKGTILTNKHVIEGTHGCLVGFVNNYNDEPYFGNRQIADIYKVSSDADVAILKLRNPNNKSITAIDITTGNSNNLRLGDQITTYGYPAKFGTKITYTSGDFSGVDGNYLKTTAIIEHGNSGGGAYLKNGAFIGIPTAVVKGSLNSMGYLLSVNKVNSWLNNSVAYNNNSNNNYSRVSAILEDMDLSALGSLGLFVAGDEANITTETESQKVIKEEKNSITKVDKNLSKRVSGNILLQVEKNGEGWYVYPDDKKKYYLGRPADAFSIMRNLGLGIKHSELENYLNTKFPSRLSGKIVLDVERNGEAYYINPKDLKGYFLNRPSDAFKVMRESGLGITNADIRKISVGEIK